MKDRLALTLVALCVLFAGFRMGLQPGLVQLFDSAKPVLMFGGDVEDPNSRVTKSIQFYTVDYSGNVFIGNDAEFTIDRYDPQGRFLAALGRRGQGPGEFVGPIFPSFAVNSKGMVFTSTPRSKIAVLNPDGSFNREVEFPAEVKGSRVGLIRVDPHDGVHVIFHGSDKGVMLTRFSPDLTVSTVYHRAPGRPHNFLGDGLRFLPDLDFDQRGNVYVTDGYDYRVYVYGPEGKLVRTFDRPFRKNKLVIQDLVLYAGGEEEFVDFSKDPDSVKMIQSLPEKDSYVPCVFGVNVVKDGFLLWTSDRDAEFRYYVDVYDRDFRLIGRSSAYNYISRNFAVVRGDLIYLPDLGTDDMALKKKAGRLTPFNIPYRLPVYRLRASTKS